MGGTMQSAMSGREGFDPIQPNASKGRTLPAAATANGPSAGNETAAAVVEDVPSVATETKPLASTHPQTA